ncbi:MAG: aminotransferase class I/II-fold pyridoxal phosphate-dependent enzyme [Clostridia bacterium]|nr:aminotransferase class I/II-fold pyridoxal phosphate-dependent enzyme [Clostridia bacterium]
MIKFADRMNYVKSGIRGSLYAEATKMEARGEQVLRLNTGNPANFGFTMPDSVRNAVKNGLETAVGYCEPQGMRSARIAIAEYETKKGIKDIDESDVFVGNGVSEMSELACLSLINPGDEVLVPSPNYSLWSNGIYIAGGIPVHYTLVEENGWMPDVKDIESKITPKTKAIVIINPNNPTGAVYSKQLLLDILEVARRNSLVVFSDEIYDRLVYGKEHYSCAALAPDLTVFTFNGLSKSHIICGYRCGWLVVSSKSGEREQIKEAMFRISAVRLCGNVLTQVAIPAALKDEESTKKMLQPGGRLYEQRKAVADAVSDTDALSYTQNDAAFYIFPRVNEKYGEITDDFEFGMGLLKEKKILIVPGSGFEYKKDAYHFRVVMLPDPDRLKKAMIDIADYIKNRR